MRRLLLLAALGGPALPLCAQSPVVSPGSKVRLRMPLEDGRYAHRYDGTVERIAGDTLIIRPNEGGASRFYTPNKQTQLLVLTENHPSVGRGAVIGGLVGVMTAGFVATLAKACTGSGVLCFQRRPVAVRNAAILGAGGAVIGATIGLIKPQRIWSRAWMAPEPRVMGGAGFGAGITISF